MASYQFHIVMLEVCNMSILSHTYYAINLNFYFHLSNNSCSHSNFMNKQHHNFYLCCNFMNKQHHRFYLCHNFMNKQHCSSYCNQKERVWKHTAHWPSTNPGVHVLLIYSTQFRPSISHSTLTAYWLFQTNITRSKTYKCFASTQQQNRFYNIHLLPRPFTQMPARETLSLHYKLCTFP